MDWLPPVLTTLARDESNRRSIVVIVMHPMTAKANAVRARGRPENTGFRPRPADMRAG